jgi:phage gpG-like protein
MTNPDISLKGADKTYKNLKSVMKHLGQEYSIKVGIIGEQASQTHKDSGLNNATLGAIHEFGATVNVTDKMRKYLHFLGIHLKKDTNQIEIPARPFLGTLLNKDVKEYIYNAAELDGDDLKLDTLLAEQRSESDGGFMEDLANIVGAKALEMVQTAFSTGGYPDKWQPITEVTKKHRLGDPNNPPLTDTGDLRNSVTVEIKKVK